ncbi:MmcQ/YjbR family DNA-binding protein [Nonomuraea sp. H19]|uniref:MmcQ/YjbR family DNA-binding protein n=1 Tax=Nonomuraea sp. H19 TaxID=3452206 RepID=UPI003F8AD3D0
MAGGWTDADIERVRERLAELAGGLPGVVVEDSFGHAGFLLGRKRLAWLLVDHHGDGRLSLCVKAPPGELETLLAADPARYFRPAYVKSWVGVELHEVEPDWAEIGALLVQAWRMTAGKRAVAAYDAEHQNRP